MMSLRFSPSVTMSELSQFRGAVIAAAGREQTLFHNHTEEGFAYRYPLVQYRIMGGKAAMLCLNDGIEQMQNLLGGRFLMQPLHFAGREEQIVVEDLRVNEYELCFMDQPVRYHISRWLAFNQENYRLWQALDTEEERVAKLTSLLVGNIISFAKGVGWQLEERVEVNIDPNSIETHYTNYKGKRLVSITAEFDANIFLPRGIALGKGVSLNRGVVTVAR